MEATLAAFIEQELTREASAEECRFRCDRCHEHMGSGFADGYWACPQCAAEILARLERER